MKRGRRKLWCSGVVAALAWVAWPSLEHPVRPAAAEWKLGAEARGEVMCCFLRRPFGGGGIEADLGYSLDTYPILIVPEIALAGAAYAPEPVTGSFRAMAGMRVGITLEVEPSLYLRGGYAGMFGRSVSEHGGTFEGGLSVDKRLEREITVGGSLGYQGFFIDRPAHGVHAGIHVGLWL